MNEPATPGVTSGGDGAVPASRKPEPAEPKATNSPERKSPTAETRAESGNDSTPASSASRPSATGQPGSQPGGQSDGRSGGQEPAQTSGDGSTPHKRRRRRGGRGRGSGGGGNAQQGGTQQGSTRPAKPVGEPTGTATGSGGDSGGKSDRAGAEGGTAPRPRIGDTRPAPSAPATPPATAEKPSGGGAPKPQGGTGSADGSGGAPRKRRRRGGRGRSSGKGPAKVGQGREPEGVRSGVAKPVTALTGGEAIELDDDVFEERRGKTRNGKPVGRYLMAVHVQPEATQIAILEGRSLIEHYVARPADDIHQIHGNIYLGRVQNVLPGMEAAFIDIGTPKNAVLYRGDLHFEAEDIEERDNTRIEQILQPRQTVLCQVTKNPIMHKGARLTQEVSLPGRFVVLVPNSRTLGISKRLPDNERKRLRKIIDRARPEGHGVIVRTAAQDITAPEIERDLARLVAQWNKIEALANKASAPALLYREPDMALRVIREEFSKDFRSVVIDDKAIFDDIHDYVASVSPALAERVVHFDASKEDLALFERFHIAEQLRKALDRKVWLPSGGSLIIEHTEALTVIDVNTGKNVGKSSLEDTVFDNNLEAAVEIARQLRLRDIGGIIVIDFVDMEIKKNRAEVVRVFREALARDKTRTQAFDISELGLVQMTRKRIGEGLLESFSEPCAVCEGRGVVFDQKLLQP